MTDNLIDNGVEKHNNITSAVSNMSIFDGIKEEKGVSVQEREEDGYQLQPLHKNGCKLQQNQSEGMAEGNSRSRVDEEKELLTLRKRLDSLRKRRRRIQQSTQIECINQRELLLKRLNARRRDRSQIVDDYLSLWKGRDSVALFLDRSKRWNVLNDCFSIWIDGKSAFATINGCRLGAEAAALPTELLIVARGHPETKSNGKWGTSATNSATVNINSPPRRNILGFFGGNDSVNNTNNLLENGSTAQSISEPVRVPWLEVNAALGHACLLLKILQESFSEKGWNGMKFTHELHPMGATSKIGIRFGSPTSGTGVLAAAAGLGSILTNGNNNTNDAATTSTSTPVIYNLYFEEASGFSFFKNNARNFNWALQAFLQCIAEAAAQQADKTIAIPHAIHHKKKVSASNANNDNSNNNNINGNIDKSANYLNGGEWTIGGLSICYPSQHQTTAAGNIVTSEWVHGLTTARNSATSSAASEWTRACRFLLTDLKWLVAYAAKHVDR